jgi:hypothetical protein
MRTNSASLSPWQTSAPSAISADKKFFTNVQSPTQNNAILCIAEAIVCSFVNSRAGTSQSNQQLTNCKNGKSTCNSYFGSTSRDLGATCKPQSKAGPKNLRITRSFALLRSFQPDNRISTPSSRPVTPSNACQLSVHAAIGSSSASPAIFDAPATSAPGTTSSAPPVQTVSPRTTNRLNLSLCPS